MKYITHWLTVLITLAVLVGLRFQDGGLTETARLKSFDYLQSTDAIVESQDIVIVEFDEKSIEAFGQWPWPRDYLADVVNHLRSQGAGLIIMPILFSEEDRAGKDDVLAQTLQGNGVIIAQTGTTQINKNAVPRGIAKIGDPIPWLFEWPGMLGPIPELGQSADGVGVLNIASERDGVVRRMPLIMTVAGETYPAMAIETIRVATGAPSYQVKAGATGVQAVRVPGYPTITTDPYARIWLRWNKQFPSVSIMEATQEHVQGKIVVIGLTAEGIGSTIAAPTGTEYAHTPVAVSLQTIINGDNIVRSDLADTYELVYLFVIGMLLIVAARFFHYGVVAGLIRLIGAGTVYGSVHIYSTRLLLFDFSWPVITTVLVGLHAVFNRFVSEYMHKQAIKKQFEGYASPTVVKLLQENPDIIKKGVEREISICFSDLRGFTNLGESFGKDVEGLTKVMNGYMDAISQPVLDSNGMIIKYIGDATMHIHNAPVDDPNHPHTAVETGMRMIEAVEKYSAWLKSQGRPGVEMGAGINSGVGFCGEMGSTKRHSYDVLGDDVSLTARFESQCKAYGVLLIVGSDTVKHVENDFFFLKLDNIVVKGKTEPKQIYTVFRVPDDKTDEYEAHRTKHNAMHELYLNKKFDQCAKACDQLKGTFDGKMDLYYDVWIERCKEMKTKLIPANWDGSYVKTTK